MNTPEKEEGIWDIEELEEKVIKPNQWGAIGAKTFKAVSVTHEKLPSRCYSITRDNQDNMPIFTGKSIKSDDIYSFKGGLTNTLMTEVNEFWGKQKLFKDNGFLHRRGYLLYGSQGTGKSSIVWQVAMDVIKRGGVVFVCENPSFFTRGLSIFRQVEPDRPIVCVFEDIDAIITKYGETDILQLLDGDNQVDRVVNIATCFPPNIRMLTTNLEWVPCGNLKAGDELWAFDEEKPKGRGARRRFRKAKVLVSERALKECVKITLNTGESIICTSDHPWLSFLDSQQKSFRLDWVKAENLMKSPNLVRPFIPWTTETTWEAGWLAGILDGEGCVSKSKKGIDGRQRNQTVTVAQNKGYTADKIYKAMISRVDVHYYERNTRKGMMVLETKGGIAATAKIIGQTRAERLIKNFDISNGMMYNKFPSRVIKVENIGIQEIQSIQTTSGTYIAEGFATHNTNYPELLDKRIVSRPRRFDRIHKILVPSDEVRIQYLKKKLIGIKGQDLKEWIKKTKGLSFAALTESLISVLCLDNKIDETISILRDIESKEPKSSDFGTGKMGFNSGNDDNDDLLPR